MSPDDDDSTTTPTDLDFRMALSLSGADRANELLNVAISYREQGEPRKALEVLNDLSHDPYLQESLAAKFHLTRGNTLVDLSLYTKAERELRTAILLFEEAHDFSGAAYAKNAQARLVALQGDTEAAIAQFLPLTESSIPASVREQALTNLTLLFEESEQFADSFTAACEELILHRHIENVDEKQAEALTREVETFYRLGQVAESANSPHLAYVCFKLAATLYPPTLRADEQHKVAEHLSLAEAALRRTSD